MANQLNPAIQNHFIAGLKTEFTGLNFPENAATETQNCVYSLIGDVTRRGGINYEANAGFQNIYTPGGFARSSFRWLNAGGDGLSQILVIQIGGNLYFYLSSAATVASPLSTTIIGDISLLPFTSGPNVAFIECQYTSGNGFLFVFHPSMDPIYVTFNPGANTVTAQRITLQIRDTIGIVENTPDNFRPTSLSNEHLYNLLNQGWTQGSGWTGQGMLVTGGAVPCVGNRLQLNISSESSTSVLKVGNSILVQMPQLSQIGANNGNLNFSGTFTATVNAYNPGGGTLSVTCTAVSYNCSNTNLGFWSGGNFVQLPNELVNFTLLDEGFINNWNTAFQNWPSNSDVWWLYKDTTGAFNPTATLPNVQALNSPAPRGSYILSVFDQERNAISSIGGLTPVLTESRPSTGAWYAGRVWYSGVNGSQQATGDQPFYTWSENIYFSQIIEHQSQFGQCYQNNDPTSENLFDILPSDGGFITIQGCGAVLKLFALRFGLLVFATNGIWFISGSTGIGFTADDFNVTKISNIRAISGSSFIEVQGYPFFWNQEGIYQVTPSSQPGSAHSPDIQLDVQNLTLGSILSYYNDIPLFSKNFARGDYDEINYIVQWCYRSEPEAGISNRYTFDTILSFNVITKAFYPYTLPTVNSNISDIKYIIGPGSANAGLPDPIFKYITGVTTSNAIYLTFSEENDFTNFTDFIFEGNPNFPNGYPYTSFFITGFTPAGGGYLRKTQVPYLYLYMRNTPIPNGCSVQSVWDYASTPNSGRWSGSQLVYGKSAEFGMVYRKLRFRGRGLVFQMKVSSIPGMPFDIMGWSALDATNAGI
jgi:hypothetical protein